MSDRLPPYPADTRAKGWRFELDYEQIDQSDTWPIAAEIPMAQHALLMMWFVAWAQVPCGSFPDDEAVIRAKCRIPASTWLKCREVLMRGWWTASDGRLYHDTLIKRVFEMMKRRRSDSGRQASRRAGLTGASDVVTRDTAVTPPEVTRESSTEYRIPNTDKRKKKSTAPPWMTVEQLVADGLTESTATAWLEHRKHRKAKLTELAWQGFKAEVTKARWTCEAAVLKAVARNWTGFEAAWVADEPRQGMTFKERDTANAVARVREITGGLAHAKPVAITRRVDALTEVFDATDAPRRLG